LCLKGRRREAEREVSRGRSTGGEAGRDGDVAEEPEVFTKGKDRTEGRANQP